MVQWLHKHNLKICPQTRIRARSESNDGTEIHYLEINFKVFGILNLNHVDLNLNHVDSQKDLLISLPNLRTMDICVHCISNNVLH